MSEPTSRRQLEQPNEFLKIAGAGAEWLFAEAGRIPDHIFWVLSCALENWAEHLSSNEATYEPVETEAQKGLKFECTHGSTYMECVTCWKEASASKPRLLIDSREVIDTSTREFCQRCHRVSPVGFHSPLWELVAGRHWADSILCIVCFAALGDEKFITWEDSIEFFPVSFATHLDSRLAAFESRVKP